MLFCNLSNINIPQGVVMHYIPKQVSQFGEWLNTAPKAEVLPYLKRALSNAKMLGDANAVAKIQEVINQVEEE